MRPLNQVEQAEYKVFLKPMPCDWTVWLTCKVIRLEVEYFAFSSLWQIYGPMVAFNISYMMYLEINKQKDEKQ
jgi:hypothetical protein